MNPFLAKARRFLAVVHRCQARQRHYLPSMSKGKISTPHFTALLTPSLLQLEKLFESAGYEIRLVGGVVRDLLLEKAPKDIDISTTCRPDRMMDLLRKANFRYIPTGLQHGTVTVVGDDFTYEITTLRADRVTDGRHAVVEFINDWKEDAMRRDLTINAMSLSLDGTLYDYFNGEQHLAERKILFVGDPRSRITEDYLRILRYFRFYGRITPEEGKHDGDTLEAIRELAKGLGIVSKERVWTELAKILTGNHAPHLIGLMYELGVAKQIDLPEEGRKGEELRRAWTAMKLRDGREPLKAASLLSSLTQTTEKFDDLALSLKLSNRERDLGNFVVANRDTAYSASTDIKVFKDMLVEKTDRELVLELCRYCDRFDFFAQLEKWDVPICPVTGRDLLESGMESNLKLGLVLKSLKKAWMESGYCMSKDELMGLVPEVQEKVGGASEGGQDSNRGKKKRRLK